MLRFTIRDVLWLMVVVGVLCAWGLERRRLRAAIDAERKEFRTAIDNARGEVRMMGLYVEKWDPNWERNFRIQ